MIGEILENRYRIDSRIGGGGMATVYLAFDLKLHRKVAVKVMHDHLAKVTEIRRRFDLEAQAVSALNHPNIVKIYDYSGPNSLRSWLVTEVIEGLNLAEYLNLSPLSRVHPMIACFIVREISKALGAAHAVGIVHRDIKPENIMITDSGLVRLMDFGIAKDLQQNSVTQTGTFMGSPSYMSPEQIKGKDVDTRSDIYSLSILFYEIVTGELPFKGNGSHDIILKIMAGQHIAPQKIVTYLPDEISNIIKKGMNQNPEQRFQKTSELDLVLDAFLFSQGFVESHVELERYFINKQSCEERLKRMICSEYFLEVQKILNKNELRRGPVNQNVVKSMPQNIPVFVQARETEESISTSNNRYVHAKSLGTDRLKNDYVSKFKRPISRQIKKQHAQVKNHNSKERSSEEATKITTPSVQGARPVYRQAHKIGSAKRRHAITILRQKAKKQSWLYFYFGGLALLVALVFVLVTKMGNVENPTINKVQKIFSEAFPKRTETDKDVKPPIKTLATDNSSNKTNATIETPSTISEAKEPEAVVKTQDDLVKYQVIITSNTRPIKVTFINTKNQIELEYIQTSLQESYLLASGEYQVKAFYQKQAKKSTVFELNDRKPAKNFVVSFDRNQRSERNQE